LAAVHTRKCIAVNWCGERLGVRYRWVPHRTDGNGCVRWLGALATVGIGSQHRVLGI